jgi:S1-C subfamily serine protease
MARYNKKVNSNVMAYPTQNASQPQREHQLLSSLKLLVLGNSANLEVGDTVIAIGNAFGLSDTMTTGIVSGIGRSPPATIGGFSIPNATQTDAPVSLLVDKKLLLSV